MKKSKELKELNNEIKLLYKKQKGLIRKKNSIVPVKQPIGIMKRRNGNNTFHEGLTGNTFEFKKSDGEEGTINLNPKFLETYSYGKDYFKGYTLHEDSAYPIGHEDILIYSDMQKQAIDKIQGEELKLLTANTKVKLEGYKKLILAVALVILAFGVYKIMVPQDNTVVQQVIPQTIQNLTGGITIIK